MTREERSQVRDAIISEGMDYALRYLSTYSHIEDEKFHQLLDAYIDAANAIEEYLG